MGEPGFWDDQEAARQVVTELRRCKLRVERWEAVHGQWEDMSVLFELGQEEDDADALAEVAQALPPLQKAVEQLEFQSLLSGEYDANNAILSIHSGAGGTESQDWADMLLRLYSRWAEDHSFEVEMLDLLEGEEAGIKRASLLIKGDYAYGYLQAEKGVHRLVRISPFDSSGRRHTSFASVDVIPEITDETEVTINPSDLRVDTYRASGAGGQHVNKTDSAVRITHLPTGIVVQCQTERSQHSNREAAMKILLSRLVERQLAEKQAKADELRGDQGEIAWGNQIRSYVFCPYTMVKDHRTGTEVGDVDSVMDGDIDRFIEAYLRHRKVN